MPSFCDLSLYFGFFRNCVLSFHPASGCSASFTPKAELCLATDHIHRSSPDRAPQLTAAGAPSLHSVGSLHGCELVSPAIWVPLWPFCLIIPAGSLQPSRTACLLLLPTLIGEHIQTSNFTPSGVSNLLYFYPPPPSPGFTD